MKREIIDLTIEREIITNLIVSDDFAKDILPKIKPRLFKSPYAYPIYTWVKEYHERYGIVPKQQIQDIYTDKQRKLDSDVAESIAELLQNLSDNYDKYSNVHNVPYLSGQALNYIKLRSLEIAKEDIEKCILSGDVIGGESIIANFKQVEDSKESAVSLLNDAKEIYKAFNVEDNDEILFKFPGAVGEVLGEPMRGDLIACIAPPKRGKSMFLGWCAELALFNGLNVVFFSLEMRKAQVLRRMFQSIEARPIYDGSFNIPYFTSDDPEDGKIRKWEISHKEVYRKGIKDVSIKSEQEKIKLHSNGGDCRIICTPIYTTSVHDLKAHLDNLKYYEGYIPDVVIVDYADLLKADKSAGSELRNQLNAIWMGLRNIAQERNVLMITATQTNRGGIGSKSVKLDNVAEDMRKLCHVSLLCGLNQTKKEYENGIMRIAPMLSRDDFIGNGEAVVLQCFSFSKFYLDSRLRKLVNYDFAGKEDESEEEE